MCNENGKITLRERDILRLVFMGYKTVNISAKLGSSSGTVNTHINIIMKKLSVSSRFQAAQIFSQCPECQKTHNVLKVHI